MSCHDDINIKVDQTFNVCINPASISVTPNGKYGYVSNSNNYTIPDSDTVTVLNFKKEFLN